MTRDEHLEWAKKRALAYLDAGDALQGITSMLSDLTKHEELKDHIGRETRRRFDDDSRLDRQPTRSPALD